MKAMHHLRARLFCFVALLVFISGCASVSSQFTKIVRFIEGEDRVEMEGSTAQVTDLVTKSAEVSSARLYADNTENESQTIVKPSTDTVGDKPVVENTKAPVSDSKPLVSKTDTTQKDADAAKIEKGRDVSAETAKVAVEKKAVKKIPKIPTVNARTAVEKSKTVNVSVEKKADPVPMGALSGRVIMNMTLPDEKTDSRQSIVRLIPTFESPKSGTSSANSPKKNVVIDMRDKTYQPQYISASKEDLVIFTNSDSISHNVFSRSGKNAFDLGTYAGGKKRGVKFKDSGIVKVYCNIHPNMATFVSVVDDGYSMVTDDNGYFRFDDIPTGKYLIEAWNIRGSVNSTATVSENNSRIELVISTLDPEFGEHKNKFGKSYSDDPALFKDEFY